MAAIRPPRPRRLASRARALLLLAAACGGSGDGAPELDGAFPPAPPTRTEQREPCAAHDPLRRPLYGDLHVHTSLSWDAWGWEVRFTPADAYRFARGEPLELPQPGRSGGAREIALRRPLDFAAVTDHAEYLAEVRACTEERSPAFATERCATFRQGGFLGQASFGVSLIADSPDRFAAICGPGGVDCTALAGEIWSDVAREAERAYDRGASCEFTSFIAYEWTGANGITNQHRNVIFRNDAVPAIPFSHFEAPIPETLWRTLDRECIAGLERCDVLAIPHNSNISNGNLFPADDPGPAELRARMEPLVEIFQHKGDSECRNGLSGILGEPDELCDFEKYEPPGVTDCGDDPGIGGSVGAGFGCRASTDFVRGALLAGLAQAERGGVNPYPLGFVASTDTHNATPGATAERDWPGHQGNTDDETAERLGAPGFNDGVVANPGGLAAVWAEENSRDAIFEALRRKESFGTSGTRIAVRLFGAFDGLPADPCSAPDLVERGYRAGVPMGGTLVARSSGRAPRLVVSALRDPDGAPLERIQIVKGWIDRDGQANARVFEVAGEAVPQASVDLATCEPRGGGSDALCGQLVDPGYDPAERAYYYARVLEIPTCRWSTYACNALPEAERPATCDDPAVPATVRERAWTSPIWIEPARPATGP